MSTLTINGVGYLGSRGSEPVERVRVSLSNTENGPEDTYVYGYVPGSTGNSTGGVTVLSVSDTQVVVELDGYDGLFVRRVVMNDEELNYAVAYNLPDEALGGPVIFVSYDDATDELVITSASPIFPVVGNEFYWLDIVGSSTNSAVGATRVSSTELRYAQAFALLGGPTTISQVTVGRSEVYTDRVTIATWTGSVLVDQPVTYPFTIDNYYGYWGNIHDPEFMGQYDEDLTYGPVVTQPGFLLSWSGNENTLAGLRVDGINAAGGSASVEIIYAQNSAHFPNNWGGQSGQGFVWHEDLAGFTIQTITPIEDVTLNDMATVANPSTMKLLAKPKIRYNGVTGTMTIDFDPPLPTPLTQVNFSQFNANATDYVWYAGPYSDASPKTTVWTVNQIVIVDPPALTQAHGETANMIQMYGYDGGTGLGEQQFANYGDPLDFVPVIASISSPAAGRLRVRGNRLDKLDIIDLKDGAEVYQGQSYADPNGPSAGNINPPGSVITWGPDEILIIDAPTLSGMTVGGVDGFLPGSNGIVTTTVDAEPDITIQ